MLFIFDSYYLFYSILFFYSLVSQLKPSIRYIHPSNLSIHNLSTTAFLYLSCIPKSNLNYSYCILFYIYFYFYWYAINNLKQISVLTWTIPTYSSPNVVSPSCPTFVVTLKVISLPSFHSIPSYSCLYIIFICLYVYISIWITATGVHKSAYWNPARTVRGFLESFYNFLVFDVDR